VRNLVLDVSRRRVLGGVREHTGAPAFGLPEPEDEPRERECGQREDDECGAPRERSDVTRHGEAEAGAEQLAREDEAVDPAALPAAEVVADEGGDHRPGRGGDRAERETGPEELVEVRRSGAPEHRCSPQHDRRPERPCAPHAVGEHAEREGRHRAHERRDGDEEPDVGVRDVEAGPQLGRRGADRRRVRAAQPEDAGENDDHARALGTAERDGEAIGRGLGRRRRERGEVGEDSGRPALFGHAWMVAGGVATASRTVEICSAAASLTNRSCVARRFRAPR
jgi:hypothetical protein